MNGMFVHRWRACDRKFWQARIPKFSLHRKGGLRRLTFQLFLVDKIIFYRQTLLAGSLMVNDLTAPPLAWVQGLCESDKLKFENNIEKDALKDCVYIDFVDRTG